MVTYRLRRGVPVDRVGAQDGDECYLYTMLTTGVIEVRKLTLDGAKACHNVLDLENIEEAFSADYLIAGGDCSCPGFVYRGSCKHVERMRKVGWYAAE
jgi:hypothetical protein